MALVPWLSASQIGYWGAVLLVIYNAGAVIYNLYFHPLRGFPGPLLSRASKFPYAISRLRGTLPYDMHELHRKYGDVVRTGPGELAFADPAAWKDIYHRPAGAHFDEMPKYVAFEKIIPNMPKSIFTVDPEPHAHLRKALAPSFSERGMREQEHLIKQYVDLLVTQLGRFSKSAGGQPQAVDLSGWYNWTTFDIIGELAFAESFGCLETGSWHTWVKFLLKSTRQMHLMETMLYLGLNIFSIAAMAPILGAYKAQAEMTKHKLQKRIELGTDRDDLIEGFLKKQEKWNLDMEALEMNSTTLFIAGSETTATLLSGVTYLLLTSPDVLKRVTDEVRAGFAGGDEITLLSVSRLPYMLACLDEALRCYPPVPDAMKRSVPKGGATIAGRFVSEGTIVTIFQYAINHSVNYWTEPFTYEPERFLGNKKFASDRLDALQPFHVGPRNCIGRTLAYAEMRLILAKILFNFDMRLADDSREWLKDQKVFTFWEKRPLNVYLSSART